MLTRSANASPNLHAFHYAPSHSPRQSPPPRNSAAPAPAPAPVRRPSSASPIATADAIAQLSVSAGQLTTSPALSHSQSASPLIATGPPSSSVDHHLSQPCPPSSASTSAPPPPSTSHASRYVAVDAATQYSPMDSTGHATNLDQNTSHPGQSTVALSNRPAPHQLPPIPGPTPMAPGIEQGVDPASGTVANGHEAAREHRTPQGRPAPGAPATAAFASTSTHAASTTSSLPRTNNPPSSSNTTEPSPTSSAASTLQQSHIHSYASPSQKRRNSQSESYSTTTTPASEGTGTALATAAAAAQAPVAEDPAAKRSRPEVAPPKMLPEQYEFCLVEDMVVLIANMLGELIETNDALALKSGHLTRFHSRTPPGISVLDYLHRLAKHATLIPPLLLSMVYYIDRLCAMYPDFTINTLTVHRFLITAATVAAKGLSDSFWNNSTYARVGGVRVNELKMLELEFLYRLDWKIVPNPEVLAAYYRPLVERCPGYALPPELTTAANSRSPSDDGDGMDDGSDGTDNEQTHRISHHRQSSTSLIGEDMVVSGLARSIRQDRG